MNRILIIIAVLVVAAFGLFFRHSNDSSSNLKAPLLSNLGSYHFAITTKVKLAQRFFDQGFILAYGFNHAEAYRSFKEAARLDPDCAMCYWAQPTCSGRTSTRRC